MNTTPKHQVHNLIILDESGSMQSIKRNIIQGFNELVQTIKGIEEQFPNQEHLISMVSFNGLGQKLLHFVEPVSNLKQINDRTYNPDASTPLYDAIGFAVNKLKQSLEGKTDYHVLVTILTDGEENASKEFSGKAIKSLIDELHSQNWTFTYIGTDHDVEKTAASMSITNTFAFSKDESGIEDMFEIDRKARMNFSKKINSGIQVVTNYFENPNKKEE